MTTYEELGIGGENGQRVPGVDYQNDTYTRKYFKFVITNPKANASGDEAGFIDAFKAQEYSDYDAEAGTFEQYTAKALGYIRWCNLVLALSRYGVFTSEVKELTGASSLVTPTKITFIMGYEQADSMYYQNANGEVYEGVDALKQIVAETMSSTYNSFAEVNNPTLDTDTRDGRKPSRGPLGFRTMPLTAEKICDTALQAKAYITITETDVNG